jgi:hypothetical protein
MGPKRVRYFPGQILSFQDYLDEQRYMVDRLDTAVRLLHGVGVVTGLAVKLEKPTLDQPSGSTVVVAPGFAIDGRGRIITVETPLSVVVPATQGAGDISIQLSDIPTDPVAANTPDGTEFSRWEEQVEVSISPVRPADSVTLAFFDGVTIQPAKREMTVAELIEAEIVRSSSWVAFEENNELLWAKTRSTITDYLHSKWVDGSLVGSTSKEAFFVKVDRSTMTTTDIIDHKMVVLVGLALVQPAEFVIVRIKLQTA